MCHLYLIDNVYTTVCVSLQHTGFISSFSKDLVKNAGFKMTIVTIL